MGELLIQKTVQAEECERFANALTGRECRCDPSKLYTISVKTHGVTEQHQGEPVAFCWSYKMGGEQRFFPRDPRTEQWGVDMSEYITDVEPLYTHADPGEVEQLRGIIRMHEKTVQEQADQLARMRAQLAERVALLREWFELSKRGVGSQELHAKTETALSASAEPSSPVREFEKVSCRLLQIGKEPVDIPHSDVLEKLHEASCAPKCGNCGASTCQACNDKGCGYLEAGNGAPVERAEFDPLEWLETEITAVDTWYRGSPSYEHDAGWMKDQARRLVAEARAAMERKS